MSEATILLVEDNIVLRDGIQTLLERAKYTVIPAGHGIEGLLKMEGNTPDLILADIVMPEMDGFQFCEAVRSRPEWVSIPFIFLTAHREKEYKNGVNKLGVEDYLLKPITQDELLTTIRSRLSRSRQLLLAQLEQSYEASLVMFANAIEVRDPYTRGHVERVMKYALAISDELGLSLTLQNHIRYGSILHDIGKIYIRKSTLLKEGTLNQDEWSEMKKHPVLGADLIRDIDYLAPAIPIIKYHHERWDGLGYPSGLSGEMIPAAARIVSIADAFDAMTTTRPYRKILTSQEAYQEIVNCSGRNYDPKMVEAFCTVWSTNHLLDPNS